MTSNCTSTLKERYPRFGADSGRIRQVVDNLLDNALKHTPAGGVVAVLAAEIEGEFRLTVRDSGAGIPAGDIERIFDRFNSLHGGREAAEKQAGAGLGLSLCKLIVVHHGGRIWATNGKSGGAAFHVALPSAAERFDGGEVGTNTNVASVLLVMKEEEVCDVAERALRLDDIETRSASEFQEALAMIESWTPDVVVVSSTLAWQLTEAVENKLRCFGVSCIFVASPQDGLTELGPATHCEPLLAELSKVAPENGTVLLVEDDEEYSSVIEFELSQAGYEVLRAFNGVDAITLSESEQPDAIVLDVMLPQKDGFEVLSAIDNAEIAIPGLVLTSLDDPGLEAKLQELGAVAVLKKYNLIQPAKADAGDRVKKLLQPVFAAGSVGRSAASALASTSE